MRYKAEAVEVGGEQGRNAKIAATPVAKRLARENGIILAYITPTGMSGQIKKQDVLGAIEREKYAGNRETAADGSSIATLQAKADLSAFFEVNGEIMRQTGAEIKVDAFILNSAAAALAAEREQNLYDSVDIGIALLSRDEILIPVIRNADKLSLQKMNKTLEELTEKAYGKQLAQGDCGAPAFVVCNLGRFGIMNFNPAVHGNGSTSLGIGLIEDIPDSRCGYKKIVHLSLSFDRGKVGDMQGACLMQRIIQYLQEPLRSLI